jgi:hypothetical protein
MNDTLGIEEQLQVEKYFLRDNFESQVLAKCEG